MKQGAYLRHFKPSIVHFMETDTEQMLLTGLVGAAQKQVTPATFSDTVDETPNICSKLCSHTLKSTGSPHTYIQTILHGYHPSTALFAPSRQPLVSIYFCKNQAAVHLQRNSAVE